MSDISSTAWIWAAKGTGAAAGSALSLVYMMPASRREACARLAAGLIAGIVFGGAAGLAIAERIGVAAVIGEAETMLMGSAAASACAWWGLGLAARLFAARGTERTGRKDS